jgi:hypothetical protein
LEQEALERDKANETPIGPRHGTRDQRAGPGPMSEANLNALERDVDALAEARDTKDELVDKTKAKPPRIAQRLFIELQERAAAHPVAAFVPPGISQAPPRSRRH